MPRHHSWHCPSAPTFVLVKKCYFPNSVHGTRARPSIPLALPGVRLLTVSLDGTPPFVHVPRHQVFVVVFLQFFLRGGREGENQTFRVYFGRPGMMNRNRFGNLTTFSRVSKEFLFVDSLIPQWYFEDGRYGCHSSLELLPFPLPLGGAAFSLPLCVVLFFFSPDWGWCCFPPPPLGGAVFLSSSVCCRGAFHPSPVLGAFTIFLLLLKYLLKYFNTSVESDQKQTGGREGQQHSSTTAKKKGMRETGTP